MDTLNFNTLNFNHLYKIPCYGFNGQEKEPELGNGFTSAEFWMYDARLGRRWNVDPVVKEYESPYACFSNNPIWFIDPIGADTSDATQKNFFVKNNKNLKNRGLVVYINDSKEGQYVDKDEFNKHSKGWDYVVADSWESAQKILNTSFSDKKGSYKNLAIRTHGGMDGSLVGNGQNGVGTESLKTIRDMASNDAAILTTGCNVAWNADDLGKGLATFFIDGTNRKYLGNQSATNSRKGFDYFGKDGVQETFAFAFSTALVSQDKYAGFILYNRDEKGNITYRQNYFTIKTQTDGTFMLTVMKANFIKDRFASDKGLQINTKKIGTTKIL